MGDSSKNLNPTQKNGSPTEYGDEEQARDLNKLTSVRESISSARVLFSGKPARLSLTLEEVASLLMRAPKNVVSLWEALAIAERKNPDDRRMVQAYAVNNGWFISDRFSAPNIAALAEFLEANPEGAPEALDYLESHVEEGVAEIHSRSTTLFPKRADIFDAAFARHDAGDYWTAIPTILSQTDGVLFDALGQYLFIQKGGGKKEELRRKRATVIESIGRDMGLNDIARDVLKAAIVQLDADDPIRQNSAQSNRPDILNRHLVLHGTDVKYGTHLNSLRCIQLLDYVMDVWSMLKNAKRNCD